MSLSSFLSRFQIRRFIDSKFNRRDLPLFPQFSKSQKTLFIISSISLFILFTVHSSQFTKHPLAQSQDQPQPLLEYMDQAWTNGGNQESYLGKYARDTTIAGFVDAFIDISKVPKGCLNGKSPCKVDLNQHQPIGGILGSTNELIASTFAPPASGIEYIASIKDSFLGKPAYAQGVGFAGLQPILPLWRGFRNIVYILSSIIFMAIGIMIILRVKISPQAIVTIQNAIPGLITTLILVTFSYAIAGLVIDASYLIQALVVAILFNVNGTAFTQNLVKPDIIGSIAGLVGIKSYDYSVLSNANIWQFWSLTQLLLPRTMILILAGLVGVLIGVIATPIAGAIGGVIVILVFYVLTFVWLLKFFLGLIKAYVTIIFKIIISPLEIGLGAFPGSKAGFSSWINDLIANIAIFPISLIFMVLANMIVQGTAGQGVIWTPTLLDGGGFIQGLTWPSGGLVSVAIAFSTLMLLSKLPELIPQLVFSIKPSPWTQAISQGYKSEIAHKLETGKNLANYHIIGPTVTEIGQRLSGGGNSTGFGWLDRQVDRLGNIRLGRGGATVANKLGGAIEKQGRNISDSAAKKLGT